MAEVLSYCGYRCDLCSADHENLKSDEDRKRVQAGWVKYYAHRVGGAYLTRKLIPLLDTKVSGL